MSEFFGTSELVPFPSLASLRVRGSVWAVLGLPQRLKPRSFWQTDSARVNSCPSRAWRAFGFVVRLGLFSAYLGGWGRVSFSLLFGTSELVPLPGVAGPSGSWFGVGCSRLTSAAEAGFPCLGFFGTSQLVPFPSLLAPREDSPRLRSGRARLPVVPLTRLTSRGFSR